MRGARLQKHSYIQGFGQSKPSRRLLHLCRLRGADSATHQAKKGRKGLILLVFAAFLVAIFSLEVYHRNERKEFMKYICKDEQKPHRARHISPHRKTLDEKRRINK